MRSGGTLATEYAPPIDLPFRYFAVALGWFAALAIVYPWHTPLLAGSFYDPRLLTFVHVNTLGVIAGTIFGASYQLLPVVLGRPIASVRLARLSWWLYVPALPLFLAGLSQGWLAPLALGGTLLFAAVSAYVGIVLVTLARAPYRDVVFWHLVASVVALAVGASLGLLLALSKHIGFLSGLTLPILASHATLMLGGWVTPLLMGVAYRLVGMFTLAEERLDERLAWTSLSGAVVGAWSLAAGLIALNRSVEIVGACALVAGVSLFAAQLVRLYRVRRRRQFDIHIPFVITGVTFGLLATGLLLIGLATGREGSDPIWVAAGWLAIAGLAQTPMQGFLYKIGPFLTWLHRYAPLAGQQPVPRLEDLYNRRTAMIGWLAWVSGVSLGAATALMASATIAVAASACLSLGAALFLLNAARVASHWRIARADTRPTSDVSPVAAH